MLSSLFVYILLLVLPPLSSVSFFSFSWTSLFFLSFFLPEAGSANQIKPIPFHQACMGRTVHIIMEVLVSFHLIAVFPHYIEAKLSSLMSTSLFACSFMGGVLGPMVHVLWPLLNKPTFLPLLPICLSSPSSLDPSPFYFILFCHHGCGGDADGG